MVTVINHKERSRVITVKCWCLSGDQCRIRTLAAIKSTSRERTAVGGLFPLLYYTIRLDANIPAQSHQVELFFQALGRNFTILTYGQQIST